MSKRLTEILSDTFNGVATMDRIWSELSGAVGRGLPSHIIEEAFLLVCKICQLTIQTNGKNRWLNKGAAHCGIRDTYKIAERGMELRGAPRNSKKRTIDNLTPDMLQH